MLQNDPYKEELLKNPEIQEMLEDHAKNKKKYYFIVASMFTAFMIVFFVLVLKMPRMDVEDREKILQIPNTKEKLSNTAQVLKRYSDSHSTYVLAIFVYLYVFLQSFAIPGPVFLSILSGALWNFGFGLLVVSLSASIGASICYLLSQTFLKGLVINTWPQAIYTLKKKIQEKRKNLFFYMLFLRFQPFIPNIAVNLGSPISGVPLSVFFLGTLVGLVPLNTIHVNTGKALEDISTIGVKPKHVAFLLMLGFASLIPTLFFKKAEKNKNM